MSLRKRIADHPATHRTIAALFAGYLRLVRATSRCELDGWDKIDALRARHGAVLIVCWHQRLMMTPWMFDLSRGPCRSLTSNARAGRLVGGLHRRFGYETMPMKRGLLGAGAMREILRGLGQGVSIGISPDGPRGPARVAKATPIQWARATQVPVVVFTFSARNFWTVPSWDRLMAPRPFTRLCLMWRVWEVEVPRRLNTAQTEDLAAALGVFMDGVTAEADARVGHDEPQV